MPKMLKVSQGPSKVKWGQILTDSRIEVKLGGWSCLPMPKMLKVSYIGVIQGQMGSNPNG